MSDAILSRARAPAFRLGVAATPRRPLPGRAVPRFQGSLLFFVFFRDAAFRRLARSCNVNRGPRSRPSSSSRSGTTLVIVTVALIFRLVWLIVIAGALAPLIFLSPSAAPPRLGDALAFVVPVGVAGGFGLFNGWFITRFNVQPIVCTLMMFIAGRGVGQVLTNGNLQVFHNPAFQFIGLGRVFGVPCQDIVMLVLVAAAAWMLRRTCSAANPRGRRQRARGAARGRAGGAVKRLVYAISGLCAGIAGLIVVSINSSSDANLVGLGMELDAIAAVAVGGTPFTGGQANVVGSLFGALLIQLLRYTLLANGVPDAAALVVKGAIIAGAVWSQQGKVRMSVSNATVPPPRGEPDRLGGAAARADRARRAHPFGALRSTISSARSTCCRCCATIDVRADQPRQSFVIMTAASTSRSARQRLAPASSRRCFRPTACARALGGLARASSSARQRFMVTRMHILPFIATLSAMLMASGAGLLLAHNQSVSVSYDTDFIWLGQGDLLGFPVPAWIAAGGLCLRLGHAQLTSFGRHVLAVGGNEEAARLMGLPVDRVVFWT